uniref:Uncharacterized protein n=1 Tax=Sphaerodactylus townsendi TaxID=933632 RepID=A0ACB8FRN9_9SAUR
MDPSWKVQNLASILIWTSLYKSRCLPDAFQGLDSGIILENLGLLSQNSGYDPDVPIFGPVRRGQSVYIPCQFTYNALAKSDSEELYGYWYQKRERRLPLISNERDVLVATNDNRKTIEASLAERFQYTGDPTLGNCSFRIWNVLARDEGEYYFETMGCQTRYKYISDDQVRVILQVLGAEDSPSQNGALALKVPKSVFVQRGLCVHVPCQVISYHSKRTDSEKRYGYWFRKREKSDPLAKTFSHQNIIVATNDNRWKTESNHFQLTGDLDAGNCSFSILNAQPQDAGDYYFQTADNADGHIFNTTQASTMVHVFVTEFTEKPEIVKSSALISGKKAVLTCFALGPCSEIEANVSWATNLTGYRSSQWKNQYSNSSWIYGSNFTFTPSLNDQGKPLTCQVWYPHIQEQIEKTILLDVTG